MFGIKLSVQFTLNRVAARFTTASTLRPVESVINRSFSTSIGCQGRTHYSYQRIPRSIPNMSLPASLKAGKIRRHAGRSGRNNLGHAVVRHRGGGHSQTYRLVDFLRVPIKNVKTSSELPVIQDKVLQLGYDPCRSARIALVAGNGCNHRKLIVAPHDLKVGDIIKASRDKPMSLAYLKPGDAYPLASLPVGTIVHNVELRPGAGAQLVRAAGTCAQIIRKTKNTVLIRLPSKAEKEINSKCLATIGRISNIEHKNRVIGKAGRNRWLNRRPKGQTGKGRALWKKKRV